MTELDSGGTATFFVTNVLNGTVAAGGKVVHGGTVVHLSRMFSGDRSHSCRSMDVIGPGFSESTDPCALVIGPTGVALSPNADTLYVADSLKNRITAIP